MLRCVRTRINLDDALLQEAQRRAAERGSLGSSKARAQPRRVSPDDSPCHTTTFRGDGLMPGVDLDDNVGLRDVLGGQREWFSRTSTS